MVRVLFLRNDGVIEVERERRCPSYYETSDGIHVMPPATDVYRSGDGRNDSLILFLQGWIGPYSSDTDNQSLDYVDAVASAAHFPSLARGPKPNISSMKMRELAKFFREFGPMLIVGAMVAIAYLGA